MARIKASPFFVVAFFYSLMFPDAVVMDYITHELTSNSGVDVEAVGKEDFGQESHINVGFKVNDLEKEIGVSTSLVEVAASNKSDREMEVDETSKAKEAANIYKYNVETYLNDIYEKQNAKTTGVGRKTQIGDGKIDWNADAEIARAEDNDKLEMEWNNSHNIYGNGKTQTNMYDKYFNKSLTFKNAFENAFAFSTSPLTFSTKIMESSTQGLLSVTAGIFGPLINNFIVNFIALATGFTGGLSTATLPVTILSALSLPMAIFIPVIGSAVLGLGGGIQGTQAVVQGMTDVLTSPLTIFENVSGAIGASISAVINLALAPFLIIGRSNCTCTWDAVKPQDLNWIDNTSTDKDNSFYSETELDM